MSSRKILVVEDIPETLAGTIAQLEELGLSIACAGNVVGAKEYLRRGKYDVIILDWRLPEHSDDTNVNDTAGEILLGNLRAGKYGKQNQYTPVIAVTAQRSVVDTKKVNKLGGCLGVVYKLYPDEMIKLLEELYGEEWRVQREVK